MQTNTINSLPRLLYLGDVPVMRTFHGSLLMYRLLEQYPANCLRIAQVADEFASEQAQLPGVSYLQLRLPFRRWMRTRFHRWVSTWLALFAPKDSTELREAIDKFNPQCILTVMHGYYWGLAERIARKRNIPLHVIVHDDWPTLAPVLDCCRPLVAKKFTTSFRFATGRFCTSPFMSKQYSTNWGVPSHVLYPYRSADCAVYDEPPDRLIENGRPVAVFAGTVNTPGYVRCLHDLAATLRSFDGQLHLFGPAKRGQLQSAGCDTTNVQFKGIVSPNELIEYCREHAQIVYVPMSFDAADAANMRAGFPSKLTDSTAMALPILVYGPADCSAVVWAKANPGVAEVVDRPNPELLHLAVERILQSANYRYELAREAASVGKTYFSHNAAWRMFTATLKTGGN